MSLERTTAAIVAIGDDRSALAHLTLVVERVSRLASLAGTSFICLSAMRIRAWRHGPLLRLLVLVVLQLILAATSWLYSSDILTRHAVASYALMPHDDDAGAGVAADAKAAPCFERAWFVVLSLLRWSTDAWLIFMQINRGLRAAYRAARLGAGEEFSLSSEISWAVRISGTALLAGSLTLPFATLLPPPPCPVAEAEGPHSTGHRIAHTGLWLLAPFGPVQLYTYLFVYVLFALALCFFMGLASKSREMQEAAALAGLLQARREKRKLSGEGPPPPGEGPPSPGEGPPSPGEGPPPHGEGPKSPGVGPPPPGERPPPPREGQHEASRPAPAMAAPAPTPATAPTPASASSPAPSALTGGTEPDAGAMGAARLRNRKEGARGLLGDLRKARYSDEGGGARLLDGSHVHRDVIMRTRFLMAGLLLRCVVLALLCLTRARDLPLVGTTAMLHLLATFLCEGQGALTFLLVGMQPETVDDLAYLLATLRGAVGGAYEAAASCRFMPWAMHAAPGAPDAAAADDLDDFVNSPQSVAVHGGGHRWSFSRGWLEPRHGGACRRMMRVPDSSYAGSEPAIDQSILRWDTAIVEDVSAHGGERPLAGPYGGTTTVAGRWLSRLPRLQTSKLGRQGSTSKLPSVRESVRALIPTVGTSGRRVDGFAPLVNDDALILTEGTAATETPPAAARRRPAPTGGRSDAATLGDAPSSASKRLEA